MTPALESLIRDGIAIIEEEREALLLTHTNLATGAVDAEAQELLGTFDRWLEQAKAAIA